MTMKKEQVWSCKIGFADGDTLPQGSDAPMRSAIADAFERLVGRRPDFVSSGWSAELTDGERDRLASTPACDPMEAVHVAGRVPAALSDLGDDGKEEARVKTTEGWGLPAGSGKFHYFVDTMALCRKYGFYFGNLDDDTNGSNPGEDCAQCAKALARRRAAAARKAKEPTK